MLSIVVSRDRGGAPPGYLASTSPLFTIYSPYPRWVGGVEVDPPSSVFSPSPSSCATHLSSTLAWEEKEEKNSPPSYETSVTLKVETITTQNL